MLIDELDYLYGHHIGLSAVLPIQHPYFLPL